MIKDEEIKDEEIKEEIIEEIKEEIEDEIELIKDIHPNYKDIVEDNNNTKKRKIKKRVKEGLKLVMIAVVTYLVAIFITTYVVQYTKVDGASMESTIANNDYLVIDKVTYRISGPKRFDIIIFPYSNKENLIKRIIGLPGEKVQIIDGFVYINDKLMKEEFAEELISEAGDASQPITLLDDEYFVLGDNRNISMDSRNSDVGLVVKDSIIGKAIYRFWPFNKRGAIH